MNATRNYAGYWIGAFDGTNQGRITLDIQQNGVEVVGTAKMAEPAYGQYEYSFTGLAGDSLTLICKPGWNSGGLNLGAVELMVSIAEDNRLTGRWRSSIGTEGLLSAKLYDAGSVAELLPTPNSVFIVHGHDDASKQRVARFLEQIGTPAVILQEQTNKGMTVPEKLELFAARAGFAVVLITPDDVGAAAEKPRQKRFRARQNVVMELGYFTARLGRSKVFVLVKGDIEMPSDFLGIVYEPFDDADGWKLRLAKELKAAGYRIDLNLAVA